MFTFLSEDRTRTAWKSYQIDYQPVAIDRIAQGRQVVAM